MKNIYSKSLLILFIIIGMTYCSQEKLIEDESSQVSTNTISSDSLKILFDGGMSFNDYLNEISEGDTLWKYNYNKGRQIRKDLISNAQTIPQHWKLLVFADSENLDAKNTIPYLAQLVDQVHSFDLRIINKVDVENLTHEYLTYDGRSSTPLILVLNNDYQEVGCWVERPAELQRWVLNNRDNFDQEKLELEMFHWYQRDKGTRTIDEITRIIKAANSGDRICPVPEEGLRGR